jgi:hypothetical protein
MSCGRVPCSTEMKFDALSLNDRSACQGRREQRHVRAGRGASLRRSPLRCDCPAVRGLVARRSTHCVRCALCAQTNATSQLWKRAARAATSPVLLGASQARRNLPARAFAASAVVFATSTRDGGLRGKGSPLGAIWVATSSAGPGSARASAHQQLTRRGCLNTANEVSEVSSATRPRTEQRSAVAAKRRPPPNERPAGCPCRDAPQPSQSGHSRTTASGRERIPAAPQRFIRSESRNAQWSH